MVDHTRVRDLTCLRARRTTRQLTQIYDRELRSIGLTSGQFSLLAYLCGAKLDGHDRLSLSGLADFIGTHRSTVKRYLRPLIVHGWIVQTVHPADRRVHAVRITGRGCAKLRKAVPFWRKAQSIVRKTLGVDATRSLNVLLDLTSHKLRT